MHDIFILLHYISTQFNDAWPTPLLFFSTVLLFCAPILPCLWLCLPFQTQIQPQTVEPSKGCATIGSKGVPLSPSTKDSHFNPLHIVRKARLVLSRLVLPWIRAWSISQHHLMLGCTAERRETASTAGRRRGKELRGLFLSSSSRDLCNGLNWFSKYCVSHWSSKHIYYASCPVYTEFHSRQEILGALGFIQKCTPSCYQQNICMPCCNRYIYNAVAIKTSFDNRSAGNPANICTCTNNISALAPFQLACNSHIYTSLPKSVAEEADKNMYKCLIQ